MLPCLRGHASRLKLVSRLAAYIIRFTVAEKQWGLAPRSVSFNLFTRVLLLSVLTFYHFANRKSRLINRLHVKVYTRQFIPRAAENFNLCRKNIRTFLIAQLYRSVQTVRIGAAA